MSELTSKHSVADGVAAKQTHCNASLRMMSSLQNTCYWSTHKRKYTNLTRQNKSNTKFSASQLPKHYKFKFKFNELCWHEKTYVYIAKASIKRMIQKKNKNNKNNRNSSRRTYNIQLEGV